MYIYIRMPGKRQNKKTAFTRKKINNGVPKEVMAAETKIQKTITLLDGTSEHPTEMIGNMWYTPYHNYNESASIDTIMNPLIYNPAVGSENEILSAIGGFVYNGDERDQRNGRRITMLTSVLNLVFHIRAQPTGEPPVYSYNMNPEFRIIQGWVKGGIDSLKRLESDIQSLYSEIPFSRYMIKYDKVISRRALTAISANPEGEVSYLPFKFNFTWKPNRRITFDKAVVEVGSSGNYSEPNPRYDGWVPFVYILNPHSNLKLVFDNIKRVNIFKDL